MSASTVSVTLTINSFPPDGGGITDYSMAVSGLPAWLAFDPTAKQFTAAMRIPKAGFGKLGFPAPGDQITLNFSANQGFFVSDIPGLGSPGLVFQKANPNPDGTATVRAVVTGNSVTIGKTSAEYSISLGKANSNNAWTIDPDFETDVTTGNP